MREIFSDADNNVKLIETGINERNIIYIDLDKRGFKGIKEAKSFIKTLQNL